MEIQTTYLEGLLVIQLKSFSDERGIFYELFNHTKLSLIKENFLQDNISISEKSVLRGLHFQKPPHSQAKFVAVLKGKVLDVVVDIRKNSATFGKHFKIELSSENKKALWIPVGFAHGFVTLESDTIFYYKCSNLYNKEFESGIVWNDTTLKIDWTVTNPILSLRDQNLPNFNDLAS